MNIKEEARSIAKKYAKTDEKEELMTRLKKLDESVASKAVSTSLGIGIVGSLIFGTGMCAVMVWNMMIVGVIIGIIGVIICIMAYPAYKKVYNKKKEEVAPLIEEISKRIIDEV